MFVKCLKRILETHSGAGIAVLSEVNEMLKKLLKKLLSDHPKLRLVLSLAKNDFKSKYASSQLGIFWAFFRPVVMACVYIFVFSIVARGAAVGSEYPYAFWLLPGLIVWFVFSDGLSSSVGALQEYSFLVKNVCFDISILPFVKVISAFIIHSFFTLLIFALYLVWGLPIKPEILQLPYYYAATFCFTLVLARIVSTCQPFFKDLSMAIEIVLLVGIWACPIMWDIGMLPEKYAVFFKLNPLYHLVQGYRMSFMGGGWFWETPVQTLGFWLLTGALSLAGRRMFKRLSTHFADVI